MERGSGVLAIRDVVAAGNSLTPLESLLNRSHPGRVRRLPWREFDVKSQAQDVGWVCGDQSRCGRHRCWQRPALGVCADWTGFGVSKNVRLLHSKLAGAVRNQDRSDGIHWGLLDSSIRSAGTQGIPGLRGKCSSSQEPARAQNGRKGLSMAAAAAYLRAINRLFPATGGDHHFAALSSASGNAGAGSRNLYSAHPEGTH